MRWRHYLDDSDINFSWNVTPGGMEMVEPRVNEISSERENIYLRIRIFMSTIYKSESKTENQGLVNSFNEIRKNN